MNSVRICPECGKKVQTEVRELQETYPVKGEPTTVNAKVRFCYECGESILDMDLDKDNLLMAFNEYRKKHKLLLPEEIKRIRNKYKLTQKSLAIVLGFGEKTITRYENGSIQERSHNNMLKLIDDESVFVRIWNDNKVLLDNTQEVMKVDELLREINNKHVKEIFEFNNFNYSALKPISCIGNLDSSSYEYTVLINKELVYQC